MCQVFSGHMMAYSIALTPGQLFATFCPQVPLGEPDENCGPFSQKKIHMSIQPYKDFWGTSEVLEAQLGLRSSQTAIIPLPVSLSF